VGKRGEIQGGGDGVEGKPWETFVERAGQKKKQQLLSAAYADTKRTGVKEREEREEPEKRREEKAPTCNQTLSIVLPSSLSSPALLPIFRPMGLCHRSG